MSQDTFAQLDELNQSAGAEATLDKLIETLRNQREYHKLFDALLLKKKYEMGLPLSRPTSLDDVPQEKRKEFEETYIASAREAGELLLEQGKIPHAWMYFQAIREPEKVAQVIEKMDPPQDLTNESEEIINIALFQGANPAKGVEFMLECHGICSTITALDQQFLQLQPEIRKQCAALLVREIYSELTQTIHYEVEQKLALPPSSDNLRELIAGRDWLFEEGNYHIDVSHLNAVVRFARSLDASDPELQKAIELAEYGSRLASHFQYEGDPPFQDFYPAHIQFFKALIDENREEALTYFRNILNQEPDEPDQQLIAYILIDLLIRIDSLDEAVDLFEKYLTNVDADLGFSFAELCQQAGRADTLLKVSREKNDLVGYASALIQEKAETVST